MLGTLLLVVIIVAGVVGSILLLLLVICACRALKLKTRHFPTPGHLKFWVRPSLTGVRPGLSSEQIFRPIEEDTGTGITCIANPRSSVPLETEPGTVEINEETPVEKPEIRITVFRESGESWNEATVKVSSGTSEISPDHCLVDVSVQQDSTALDSQPAIPKSNSESMTVEQSS